MTFPQSTDPTLQPAVSLAISEGVAVIRIDQPGKPVNVLSAQVIEEFSAIIAKLEQDPAGARAAAIVSGKPGVWIAGADVEQLRQIDSAEKGEALSRRGHELLQRLEQLPMPVVAAIDGAALGGGLEVALACGYRIASDSPKTKVGLPEVQLGLLPGGGGTQRLPRLIGLRSALDLMLTGKQLDAKRARSLGLVDEVVPSAILLNRAIAVAIELADGKTQPKAGRRRGSPQWIENLPGLRAFILRKARQEVMEKTKGLYPAPLRIIELVSEGLDRPLEDALKLEAAEFGKLTVTPEAKSLTHLFFASTAAKNDPMLGLGARPREVERVAVVGAGFMGAGIAAVTAENEMRVRLKDVNADAVARGLASVRKAIRERALKRRLRDNQIVQITDRVEGTVDYTGFRNSDLVIEAVFEDIDLKHRVIREIESAAAEDTILASNTSTIPITILAESARRPGELIGLHFFSPVEKMPLVEIIMTPSTEPSVAATCHAYAKRIGKTPIIVNDAPGFYVNRILGPYMNEAAFLLQEGVAMEAIDRAMVDWGFPVGPITLFDEVGLEVAAKSGQILAEAFPDRVAPSEVIARLLADDRKGRKNGRGFYRYDEGEKKGPDDSVYTLIGAGSRREMPAEEIVERLSLGMINEAIRTLADGVLRSPRDGDVGAVFGFGFPAFRGGPFWYADSVGPDWLLDRLRPMEKKFGARFAPAKLLVDKAASGDRFYGE